MKRSISHASKPSEDVQDTRESWMPGLPKAKWKEIFEKEENDTFILGIREEIVQNCLNISYENYLKRQSVAFTVHCAYLALVKVIGIYHMFKDPGDTDAGQLKEYWEADDEPQPSEIDSWGSQCIVEVAYQHIKTETVKEKETLVEEKPETKFEKATPESLSIPSSLYENPEEYYSNNNYSESDTFTPATEKSIFSRTLSMSKESLLLMEPASLKNGHKIVCQKQNKKSNQPRNNDLK